MPPSSPAQAPVRSIVLGSNFNGVGVHGAAAMGVGAVVADGVVEGTAAEAVVDATAAEAVVDADGVGDAEEPQPTRQAQTSPINTM